MRLKLRKDWPEDADHHDQLSEFCNSTRDKLIGADDKLGCPSQVGQAD